MLSSNVSANALPLGIVGPSPGVGGAGRGSGAGDAPGVSRGVDVAGVDGFDIAGVDQSGRVQRLDIESVGERAVGRR